MSNHRRGFMKDSMLTLASLGLFGSSELMAGEDDEQVAQTVSEHARANVLPPGAFERDRWVPDRTGNFDLSEPLDNHYAFAKVQASLAGEISWLYQYGWILIAPPGKPAYPFLGRVTLAKVFVTQAEKEWAPDVGPHDYTLWGTFTTTHVDPRHFEPVRQIRNPYTGKDIEPPDLHYADRLTYRLGQSIVVPNVDPKFYEQPWDRDGGFSQHHIDAGEEVSYTVLGSSQHDGPHQPRVDVGFWTVKKAELMNPEMRDIYTRRDYSVIQKMTEYAWYGADDNDPAQIFVHLTGAKVGSTEALPALIKRAILEPQRARFLD